MLVQHPAPLLPSYHPQSLSILLPSMSLGSVVRSIGVLRAPIISAALLGCESLTYQGSSDMNDSHLSHTETHVDEGSARDFQILMGLLRSAAENDLLFPPGDFVPI